MLGRVNTWLAANPKWRVNSCETVPYDTSGFMVTANQFPGLKLRRQLRALRLWLVPHQQKQVEPLAVKCINVVPRVRQKPEGGAPVFETLDEMVLRVNETLANKPINGTLLNVETLAAPVEGNWIIDTERCTELNEDECEKQPFVHFVRIYYEFGNQLSEQIAIHDFVPVQHDWDSLLAVLNYEPFSSVLRRASTWLRNQEPGTRLLSAQLVEVPLPKSPPINSGAPGLTLASGALDSQRMFFPPVPSEFTLKFMRIACARPALSGPEKYFPSTREPPVLNCKIFVPTKLVSGDSGGGVYEDMSATRRKMEAWLQTTGAKVLGAQSLAVKLPYASSSLAASIDSCLTPRTAPFSGHWLLVYKIYLDGHYIEPPSNLLPVDSSSFASSSQSSNCCVS